MCGGSRCPIQLRRNDPHGGLCESCVRDGDLAMAGQTTGMFGLEGQPLEALWALGITCTVILCLACRNSGEKVGHAIVVDRRAPLPHGGMNRVEDVESILSYRVLRWGNNRLGGCCCDSLKGQTGG